MESRLEVKPAIASVGIVIGRAIGIGIVIVIGIGIAL